MNKSEFMAAYRADADATVSPLRAVSSIGPACVWIHMPKGSLMSLNRDQCKAFGYGTGTMKYMTLDAATRVLMIDGQVVAVFDTPSSWSTFRINMRAVAGLNVINIMEYSIDSQN